jgi:putative FmdB family regulatory protein
MPAYEYQCDACESRFQERQKMSDPEIESCPECSGTVKRLISGGAGVISKGGVQHTSEFAGSGARCDLGGPCCGQGGNCSNQEYCEQ